MSNNNYNNKTIDNRLNRHNYNKLKLSPINSLSDEKENKNINNNTNNSPLNSLFIKLKNFKEIIELYSPEMENIYSKFINNLYNEFKKLENEKKKNKINLSINKTQILPKNRSNRGNSFSKTTINFYDNNEKEKEKKLMEIIKIYKIKIENNKYKIDELKCQLEDLKSYSNTLEKTLEDKNNNDFSNNSTNSNPKNINKFKIVVENNKNLIKSLENLSELIIIYYLYIINI